ncbi:hypothetical protein B5F40_15470 [Gordonibacter sp. An230]|uniref:HipA domain-containing protein n=1 Tax=Gordonibacter sp. An230 TaxID=1965592 RepID=UPI000B39F8D8|nr:HipA domain-containing protein [Gordonibacter sp. An230]OUO86029.1 hypothetical protein B5F40_15470 [Gordonibacter sp. An230]
MDTLEVFRFYNGEFEKTGTLGRRGRETTFAYDPQYLTSAHPDALSFSLPLRSEPFPPHEHAGFFEGIIPEGRMRQELSHRLGVPPSDWLSMLARLNCECVGALMFCTPDTHPEDFAPSYEPFAFERFEELLAAPAYAATLEVELTRLSLAGAQAKVGLCHTGDDPSDNWLAPFGTAPSTHIVKIPDERHPHLAVNEYLCMEAARACGLSVAEAFIVPGKRPLLAVRRFDRMFADGGARIPIRLHQEDFCQAAGLPPYGKYEFETTDNYAAIANRVLNRCSSDLIRDKTELARQIAFDYLVGNCDNHLKNYSLLYSPDWERRNLAPAYDLVSTTVLGYSRVMGVSVGDTRNLDEITTADWRLFADDLEIPGSIVFDALSNLSDVIPEALRSKAAEEPAPHAREVAEAIIDDMRPRTTAL